MTKIEQMHTHPSPRPTQPAWLPLLIIAVAMAVSLHALAADSFWGDEILTASFAAQSPAAVIRWTAADIHPPLYYLLVGAFTQLTVPLGDATYPTPTSDWLWRFPSVLAAVLTVAVTYRLARHMTRPSPPSPLWWRNRFASQRARGSSPSSLIAATAALLLAVAPIAVKYGQEARMHALFMLLAALSTLLLFRAMARPRRWLRWVAYALALTATIYTMYFGFLILATQAALALCTLVEARRMAPQIAIGFAAAVAAALVLYLPWWPVLLGILRQRAEVGAIEGGVGHPLTFITGVVEALGPTPTLAAWLFFGLYLIGLAALARWRWPAAVLAALWLGLPTALPLVLGDPRALQFRYAFVLPVYLTTIAGAAWAIAGRWGAVGQSITGRRVGQYAVWALATISLISTLGIYQQPKPNWREAAAYLTAHTQPADIILIGPLWDEGRFIGYYYQGQAPLLTPAALVTNIGGRAAGLREGGGRIWAVNRFAPAASGAFRNIDFGGVVVSEPTVAVYEPQLLAQAAIDLAGQAVDAAYPWAEAASAQGVLDPDPRTARAGALRALGDAWLAAGQAQAAVEPYQTAVDIFPGWVDGFIALAEAQEAAGNLPAAAEAYRQAVAFKSDWQGTAAAEATALVEAGRWGEAIARYKQIIGNKTD
jgi:uncharacterized membrane protein